MVVLSTDPRHGISGVNTRRHGEAREERPRSPQAAVTRDFHQFTGSGSTVNLLHRVEHLALVIGKFEVGPRDHSKRPGDFRVNGPPLIQIHREVGRSSLFIGYQVESSPSANGGVIRKNNEHARTPLSQ